MDIKKKIDDFSATLASGLKDDPELMLDVKEEIKSHIEESCEHFRNDGKNDDQAFDFALKNFGSSADIGSDIINANRKRMKIRAAVKLAFRAVIIPLSVILALYVSLYKIYNLQVFSSIGITFFPSLPLSDGYDSKENKLCREKAEKEWESDPGNKILLGNYITEITPLPSIELISESNILKIKSALHSAEEFEPQNARYNYILAEMILAEASEVKNEDKNSPPKSSPFLELKRKSERSQYFEVLTIKDIPKFESGLKEFLNGARKEYYNTYSNEMLDLNFKKLTPPKHFEDLMSKLYVMYTNSIPDPGIFSNLNRRLVLYSEYLTKKGRKQEALELLDGWCTMLNQFTEYKYTLLDAQLFLFAIPSKGKTVAELYRKLGETKKAEKIDSICGNLKKLRNEYWPIDEKYKKITTAHEKQNNYIAKNHAGLFGGFRLQALSNAKTTFDKKELSPMRELDYLLFERGMLDVLIYIILIIMLICSLVTMYRFLRNGTRNTPILLLPGVSDTLKVLTYGIIVPFAIYILYSRYTYFGRHEYTIIIDLFKRLLEFFTLVFGSAGLVMSFTQLYIFRKAAALSIISADMLKFQKLRVKAWIAVLILLGICSILTKGLDYKYGISALGIIVLAFILNVIIAKRSRFKKNETIRKGTVARSMIPVFSFALLVLVLVCHPVIELRERYVVRQNGMDYPLIEQYEFKLVQTLNQEIKKIFEDAGKISQ